MGSQLNSHRSLISDGSGNQRGLVPYSTKGHICSMSTITSRSSRFRPSMGRSLLAVLLWCASFGLVAQKPEELDYLIRFTAPIASVQEKYIHETLQNHEPGAWVWVDRPNSQVKVRTHVGLDRATLEAAWTAIGLTITTMGPIETVLPQERSMQATNDPFPALMNTGDPAVDNAAFDAAKAAWITAHPEAYQLMTAPREH